MTFIDFMIDSGDISLERSECFQMLADMKIRDILITSGEVTPGRVAHRCGAGLAGGQTAGAGHGR